MTLANLSDEELLSSLSTVCFESRRLLGRLLLHLIEVEERRLDLRSACSSLYDFCLRRLGMSDNEAVRRIEAARLVKRFPALLGHIERGELHLTALLELRRELTQGNVNELVAAVRGKTKVEIQTLLAAQAPKPDVMPTITPLPCSPLPSLEKVESPSARIEPLAPMRHRLELTISDDVRAKLERARDLLGHTVRNQDLEAVLERALDALLANLEKTRVGDGVSRAVRREVFERDGEACTFTDSGGNRCASRTRLELDHIIPRALGGANDAANLRVVCHAHNRLYAEQVFGREHVERQIRLRRAPSHGPAGDPVFDVARRTLTGLGFHDRDVRRALRRVLPNDATIGLPMPDLVRAAIGLLT